MTGATLGLVGLGQTGRAVAERARGFRMRLLYAQPRAAPADVEARLGVTRVPLDTLFAESDVVSLHCPLTPETRGLVSRERLRRMRPTAALVNTARGACVDAEALAEALREGHIAGAGLDVFEDEPDIPEMLRGLDRVVLTTHIGSADEPTRAKMGLLCVQAVAAVLRGEEPSCRVA